MPRARKKRIQMSTSKRDTASGSGEAFPDVEGIGPKRAAALARLGVPDRSELARCEDTAELAARLRDEGVRGVSLQDVQRWVDRARELEPRVAALPRGNDMRGVQYPEPPEGMLEGWTPTASFTIWFAHRPRPGKGPAWRSLVYDEGGAGEWREFEGVETWVSWVSDRAGLPQAKQPASDDTEDETSDAIETQPTEGAVADAPVAPVPSSPESDLELTKIEVARRGGIPPGIDARIRLRVGPRLRAIETARGSLTCSVLVQLQDPDSETVVSERIDHSQLAAGEAERDVQCTLAFPPPGRYRLRARVSLGPDGQAAEREGPELTVV
jgi:hypothetical protein